MSDHEEALVKAIAPAVKGAIDKATRPLIERIATLEDLLGEIPEPERGEKGDRGDSGPIGEKGADGKDGLNGKDGADGVGLAGAIIDKDGNLAITTTKGDVKPLGRVVGKDGKDGKDGESITGPKGDPGERGEKGDKGDKGEPGDSVDMESLRELIFDAVEEKTDFDPEKLRKMFPAPERGEKGENGKDGKDGKDADTDAILSVLRTEIKQMFDAIEKPKDGKDGSDGKDGEDGKSVTLEDVTPLVNKAAEDILAKWPKPKDGAQGEKGEKGDPGRGIRKTYISQNGNLNVVYTDDDKEDCGLVVGPEGAPGLGFDDIRVEHDGERGFWFVFERGDDRKKHGPYTIPAIIGRGLYKHGEEYQPGDVVTDRGSWWLALEKTSSRPGAPDSGWVLSVKKGRDGKDGERGEKGEKGKDGRPGRDLTQMGSDGSKW